jgi:hypothetical protein
MTLSSGMTPERGLGRDPHLKPPRLRCHNLGMRRTPTVLGPSLLLALVVGVAADRVGASASPPPLTRNVPRFVTQICATARQSRPPLPIVCPPLVPTTKYRPFPGLSGVTLGNTSIPRLKPPTDRIYLASFNAGDNGPTYRHWIAGMGSPEAIRYWVLSDARNEVKGKPKRLRTVLVGERKVEIWKFPGYPAGGAFGGHVGAITRSGPYLAIASIHGDNADADVRMVVALARKADAAR